MYNWKVRKLLGSHVTELYSGGA